jgi:hypothetical protein
MPTECSRHLFIWLASIEGHEVVAAFDGGGTGIPRLNVEDGTLRASACVVMHKLEAVVDATR